MAQIPASFVPTPFTISELADQLKKRKDEGKRTTLLIGAGCSVSAGVPMAGQMIEIIKAEYPEAYMRAMEKDAPQDEMYAACMDCLEFDERQALFTKHIEGKPINFAHLAIARLMREGYIQRVLTVNFDDLLARACAVEQFSPAIYDLSLASDPAKFAPLQRPALFYLYGQLTGYSLVNSSGETVEQATRLSKYFRFGVNSDLFLIVGYSGVNDALFKSYIAPTPYFDESLYWVSYASNEPDPTVYDALFSSNKSTYLMREKGSDQFFEELARELNIFPPLGSKNPFAYINSLLSNIKEWQFPGRKNTLTVIQTARKIVQKVIRTARRIVQAAGKQEESDPVNTSRKKRKISLFEANTALKKGDYKRVLSLYDQADAESRKQLTETIAWVYGEQGTSLLKLAQQETGEEAIRLCTEAIEKYRQALALKHYQYEILCNWGIALTELARQETGEEAKAHFGEAIEKCRQSLAIKPDDHETLNNLGNALLKLAHRQEGAEAIQLFKEAQEVLEQAEQIKPGSGSYNLACLAASSGEDEECKQWLTLAQSQKELPVKSEILEDTDFALVRDRPWFHEFLAQLPE